LKDTDRRVRLFDVRQTLLAGASLALLSLDLSAIVLQERPVGPPAGEPHRFLRTVAGFSPAQLAGLDRGEPLAKVLDTDRRQIAVVGAIRVKASRERLFSRYRDVSRLRASAVVLEVGAFGASPGADDLRGLTFEDYDLQTIRDCKPGGCGVRLSTTSMARFSHEVDWRAANWREQAGSVWRRLLAEYAAAYLATGTLAEYHNREAPLSVAEEFGVLFDESRYFAPVAPEFFAYLQQFPRTRLAGTDNILYWTKDNMGVRPVTSVTHLTLYAPPSDTGSARRPAMIATKQIYATHYFDAALGLTLAFDDNASGFYLLSVNRVRTRSLTSLMRAMVRSTVQRRSRDAMENLLRSTKVALERSR
jgi:hypothetical protein